MPTPTEIMAGLREIANRGIGVALAWHVVVAAALFALAMGWRPSQRVARAVMALPLASVAAFAFAFGNPFNGSVFAAGSVALVALSRGRDPQGAMRATHHGTRWTFGAGSVVLAFGWSYPHFLEGPSTWYLFAAPLGLIPCPSLAAAIGFALLGGGFGSRAWSVTLSALGLFYGLFGVLRLGVLLDIGLALAAAALLVNARTLVPEERSPRR